MNLKHDTRKSFNPKPLIVGIEFSIMLLLLLTSLYSFSSKALGKTGVVIAVLVFLLVSAALIAGMIVVIKGIVRVIKSALRRRKGTKNTTDRVYLILWGLLLPFLFALDIIIGLPFLQDCLEGKEITQQFLVREICLNYGRHGTVLFASAADADREVDFDTFTFYDDINGTDPSVIQFHSGRLANITFLKDFFDAADINSSTDGWVMTSTNTKALYATITYYPRTHAILAYKDVKTVYTTEPIE